MNEKKKVLVVDDNQDFNQLLQYALEEYYEMFSAVDGREGIKKAAEIQPDIILMDVMMPNISGIEMARTLVAEEETSGIPIIVLTGSKLDPGTPMLFKQEKNVKHFLSKTTPLMEIVELVNRILSGG